MPRPEKVQAVADIKERIEGAQAVFLAEYAGLSVKDQQDLRRELRENGAEFKVVKMTMARLAAAELDIDTLDELLLGQTGIAFANGDPAGTAKVLKEFAKSHETFVVKGGLLDLEFLPPETIAELAELEPRDVLLAKIAGVMQAPMANLAGLLAALPRNTANVLSQLLEQKEADAPAVTAAEEAPEESAEEVSADEDDAVSNDTAAETDDAPEDDAPVAEASDEPSDASDDAETESSTETDDASSDADEVAEEPAKTDTTADASADAEVEDDASADTEADDDASAKAEVEDDAPADAEDADTDDQDETPADAGDEE